MAVGEKFGKWTILEYFNKDQCHRKRYKCRCECGFERIIALGDLKSKNTTQCRKCADILHRKPLLEKLCVYCKKNFMPKDHDQYRRKLYCSNDCYRLKQRINYLNKLVTLICQNCNKEYKKDPWHAKRKLSKFCSIPCKLFVTKGRAIPGTIAHDSQLYINKKFNNWTILEFSHLDRNGQYVYKCKCDCGYERAHPLGTITSGSSVKCKSCHFTENTQFAKNHGMHDHPLYKRWRGIKQRCENSKWYQFHLYGGRGIKVCERWQVFLNFLKDMGNPPGPGYALDRIDPDGDYEPSNCRWILQSENNSNRRNSPKYKDKYIYIAKDKLCEECKKNNCIKDTNVKSNE